MFYFALKKILCIKNKRSTSKDFTVRHNNRLLQLTKSTIAKNLSIEKHTNGSILLRINYKYVHFKDITHLLILKNKKKQIHNSICFDPVSLKEIPSSNRTFLFCLDTLDNWGSYRCYIILILNCSFTMFFLK